MPVLRNAQGAAATLIEVVFGSVTTATNTLMLWAAAALLPTRSAWNNVYAIWIIWLDIENNKLIRIFKQLGVIENASKCFLPDLVLLAFNCSCIDQMRVMPFKNCCSALSW